MENLYVMERTKKVGKRRLRARTRWILQQLCMVGMILGFVFLIAYAGGEGVDGGFHLKERLIGVTISIGVMAGCGWLWGRLE